MSPRRLPPAFVSHGAPTIALARSPAHDFLAGFGRRYEECFGRPRAILCVSAHWETAQPAASGASRPETVHDFYGFPPPLYQLRYPAPGAPDLAARAAALCRQAGIACDIDPDQGLDHGAWIPLWLMWPAADIPVAQFAIQPPLGPRHHLALGAALAPLVDDCVLVLASGGAVHNVPDAMRRLRGAGAETPAWAAAFARWLDETLAAGRIEELADYRARAPGAVESHPRDEHLLPLFVAVGAAGTRARARSLHAGFEHGSLSMAAWMFEPAEAAVAV
jgi:4,5-DOPA dioxygenase extradiol